MNNLVELTDDLMEDVIINVRFKPLNSMNGTAEVHAKLESGKWVKLFHIDDYNSYACPFTKPDMTRKSVKTILKLHKELYAGKIIFI